MLEYRLVGLGEFHRLAQSLVQDHFNEVASSKGDFDFELNWRILQDMSDAGFLYICAAFADSNLVGYALIMKVPNLIHAQVKTCAIQSMYLAPKYRKGSTGIRLVRFAENVAKALEAEELRVSISKNSKSSRGKPLSGLFTNLGYKFKEVVYSKKM